jgi:alkylation response protein AidB-like acyl-CoA dehydrogenase
MKFELTAEQRDFAASLDSLLSNADTVAAARSWASGDHAPGLALWARLTDAGVPALVVPEDDGGLGATPVELVIAFEALGRYAVPGPWVESAAHLAIAADPSVRKAVSAGTVATVAVPPCTPFALDADAAGLVLIHTSEGVVPASAQAPVTSVDPTRRLFRVTATEGQGDASPHGTLEPDPAVDPAVDPAFDPAFDLAVLACAAQLLGAGERVLADSVDYVKQRTQFGRPIGSYQAIKHRLADVRIALDFALPLVWAAALDPSPRNVSAAKVAAGDAAYLASRAGLQVHGAIGYTQEFDLSLWLLKIRALLTAWGTADWHRQRILASLTGARP